MLRDHPLLCFTSSVQCSESYGDLKRAREAWQDEVEVCISVSCRACWKRKSVCLKKRSFMVAIIRNMKKKLLHNFKLLVPKVNGPGMLWLPSAWASDWQEMPVALTVLHDTFETNLRHCYCWTTVFGFNIPFMYIGKAWLDCSLEQPVSKGWCHCLDRPFAYQSLKLCLRQLPTVSKHLSQLDLPTQKSVCDRKPCPPC